MVIQINIIWLFKCHWHLNIENTDMIYVIGKHGLCSFIRVILFGSYWLFLQPIRNICTILCFVLYLSSKLCCCEMWMDHILYMFVFANKYNEWYDYNEYKNYVHELQFIPIYFLRLNTIWCLFIIIKYVDISVISQTPWQLS